MNDLWAVVTTRGSTIMVLPLAKDWAAVAQALERTLREQGVGAFLTDAELTDLARRLAVEVASTVYPGMFNG